MSTQELGASTPRDYRLKVENFGPIIAADVEFRPLTVFVGPSNTGKSYLAALLYSLHRNSAWGEFLADGSTGHDFLPARLSEDGLPDSLVQGVRDWLTRSLSGPGDPPAFPADLETILRATCEKQIAEAMSHQLRRCFGVSDLTDLKRWSSSAKTKIECAASPFSSGGSSLSLEISGDSVSASLGDLASMSSDDYRVWSRSLTTIKEGIEKYWVYYLATEVTKSLFGRGFASMMKQAYHLPAERAGLIRHHEAVVRNLLQTASTNAFRAGERSGPILPGIAADFLERVVAIRSTGKKRRHAVLGADVERRLLGGRVGVRRNAFGYPEFTYRSEAPGSPEIPLARTSAMVSDLASLALYLHSPVRPGDVLIIEEPEAHMHPEKQTAMARQLARMVQNGIRVVITTHSGWLTEHIGNLVRLSSLPEEYRENLSDSPFALRAEDVGIWLFTTKKRPRGSVVEEIEVDRETGEYPTGFDAVSEAVCNTNAEIYNRHQQAAE